MRIHLKYLKKHNIVSFLICYSLTGLALEASPKGIDSSWVRIRIFEKLKQVSIRGERIEIVNKAESFRNVSIPPLSQKKLTIEFEM